MFGLRIIEEHKMSANSKLPAIIACLIAAALWGLLWHPLRLLEQMGLPGIWGSIFIYVFALIAVFPFLIRQAWPKSVPPMFLLFIGLAAGWTNLAFILALLEGTVVRVLLLFYLSPIWAVILACLFLKEAISPKAYFHLVLAFFGAMVLLWNDQQMFELSYADTLAVSSGFAFALTNLLVRKVGDIPIIFKMVPAWLGVLFVAAIWLSLGDIPGIELQGVSLLAPIALAAAVGIFGMTIMTYTAQYGVTHLPIHQSATLFLFEVPVGAVSAALLSQETMAYQEWIGGGLVMLAAWLSAKLTVNSSDQ